MIRGCWRAEQMLAFKIISQVCGDGYPNLVPPRRLARRGSLRRPRRPPARHLPSSSPIRPFRHLLLRSQTPNRRYCGMLTSHPILARGKARLTRTGRKPNNCWRMTAKLTTKRCALVSVYLCFRGLTNNLSTLWRLFLCFHVNDKMAAHTTFLTRSISSSGYILCTICWYSGTRSKGRIVFWNEAETARSWESIVSSLAHICSIIKENEHAGRWTDGHDESIMRLSFVYMQKRMKSVMWRVCLM